MKPPLYTAIASLAWLALSSPPGLALQSGTPSLKTDAEHLQALGDSLQQEQEPAQALKLYEAALAKFRSAGDRESEAELLRKMGAIHYDLEELQEALSAWQAALEIYRQTERRHDEAEILKNIGWIHDDLSDYPAALSHYEQALALAKEIGDAKLEGQCLNNLGVVHNNLSQYSQALAHYQKSLEIRQKLPDRKGEAATLNNMGMVYDAQSKHRQALDYYRQSLQRFRDLGELEGQGRVLGNMGVAQQGLSDYPKALDYYRQSLEIKKQLEDRRGEGVTLNNIGVIYDLLFDQRRALEFYRRSLEISRELGDRKGEGETLDNMGAACAALDEHGRALEYLELALVIKKALGDRRGEGITLSNLGLVQEHLGNHSRALEYYHEDLNICLEQKDLSGQCITLINIGELHTRIKHYTQASQNIQEALSIALRLKDEANLLLAYAALGRCYGAQGQDSLAIKNLMQAIEIYEKVRGRLKVEAHKSGYAQGAAGIYEATILSLLRLGRVTAAFDYAERSRARAFLDMLASGQVVAGEAPAADYLTEGRQAGRPAAFAEQNGKDDLELASLTSVNSLTLGEVQKLLGEKTILLEYFITDLKLLIWLITGTEAQLFQVNIGGDNLAEFVRGFRDAIVSGGAVQKRSQRLYDLLLSPLAERIRGKDVLIVPHGILHYLPFQALQNAKGEYLLDQCTVRYLPSASVMKFLERKRRAKGQSLLALGNPRTNRSSYAEITFAEKEVKGLTAWFPRSEVFVKAEASETAFKTLASRYDVLHLACHSDLDAAYPLHSSLLLAPGDGQDGELNVHELFALSLKADLVTLSACQTGLGHLTNGDELVGLARAFIWAGTPSVLASLWQVADESTSFLMSRFYEHFQTQDKAQALKQAQQETRERYAHPYAWASFVLIGESE